MEVLLGKSLINALFSSTFQPCLMTPEGTLGFFWTADALRWKSHAQVVLSLLPSFFEAVAEAPPASDTTEIQPYSQIKNQRERERSIMIYLSFH